MADYRNPFLPPKPARPLVSAAAARDRMIRETAAAGHGFRQSDAALPLPPRPPARPLVSAEAARERMIADTIRRSR